MKIFYQHENLFYQHENLLVGLVAAESTHLLEVQSFGTWCKRVKFSVQFEVKGGASAPPPGTRQKRASAPEALANAISEHVASAAKAATLWAHVRRG